MRCTPNIGIGAVGLLCRITVRQFFGGQERAHFGAAAHLAHEVDIEPRFVNSQIRISEKSVAIEALNVVAFECAAVTPDVDTVMFHFANKQSACHCSSEWCRVEIGFASSCYMKRTALQRCEALLNE